MAETLSSSGRKRAQVDGPLASSSASSSKFDGAVRVKSFLKMQKIAFQGLQFSKFFRGGMPPDPTMWLPAIGRQ